jgi:hypothetical protein
MSATMVARTALAIVGASMMPTIASFPWGGLPRGASLAVVRSRIPIASAVQSRSGASMLQTSAPPTSSAMLGAVLLAAMASTDMSDALTIPRVEQLSRAELRSYLQVQQRGGALPGSAAIEVHVVDSADLDRLYDFDPLGLSPESVRGVSQPPLAEGAFNTNID